MRSLYKSGVQLQICIKLSINLCYIIWLMVEILFCEHRQHLIPQPDLVRLEPSPQHLKMLRAI